MYLYFYDKIDPVIEHVYSIDWLAKTYEFGLVSILEAFATACKLKPLRMEKL